VENLLEDLINRVNLMNALDDDILIKLEPRHHNKFKKQKHRSTTSKQKKRRIFSSSEDDSSSSSDDSLVSENNNTLINEDSDDDDEQQALRNRHGVRTRNELAIDDLPPIENLTITLSDETPIERIGYIRHIIDGKLVIIESLLQSPPLNDDSVLFNRDRRSIGLIFETFGPVEKPYYSIRYNDINSIHQRQIELNQEIFYAPKETTYTKYVFVQELKALKGSDASWEDDNEPPKFAIDYSDDEQERTAKAVQKGKRNIEESTDEQMMDSTNNDGRDISGNYSNYERGRGRGRHRGFRRGCDNRPPPSLPNWFQNTSNPYRPTTSHQQSPWQNHNNPPTGSLFSFSNVSHSGTNNPNIRSTTLQPSQGNNSTHSIFPWM
jgi:rRNA processing protein Gar1